MKSTLVVQTTVLRVAPALDPARDMMISFTHYPADDMGYVKITNKVIRQTKELGYGILVDLDDDANVVGYEIFGPTT